MALKLKVVEVPSIQKPIQDSPGFAKKELADAKLDIMALCGFGCSYCSSNSGNYLRINRDKFAALTETQIGERLLPSQDPSLTFTWPDVEARLDAQLKSKPLSWGAGKTLVFSQLTDAFSPLAVSSGLTERVLRTVLAHTAFRIRVLTKGAVVGSEKWIALFRAYPSRFVVGLSTGTLDDEWARKVEVNTSSPAARLKATRALQDAGVPTFGMLCPIFPDMLEGDGLERLVNSIRPAQCETVWAEPYNDRDNWQAVRAGYDAGTLGRAFMTNVYANGERRKWSNYALELYTRLLRKARAEGWLSKLRYLLYEGDVNAADARALAGLEGVLLQSAPEKATGWSANPGVRAVQRFEGNGYVGWPVPQ